MSQFGQWDDCYLFGIKIKASVMSTNAQCIIVDDDAMTRKIIQQLVGQTESLELLDSFESAVEASNFLRDNPVDILFLDVEMPGMTGLELIESISLDAQVILVTSKEKYAVPAFDLNVTDFIVKPVDYPRFLKAVNKALEKIKVEDEQQEVVPGKLFVKVDHQLVGLDIENIQMVEAMADYVRIYTDKKRYTVYSSMKGIVAKLPPKQFMRVHRSYIVNLRCIDTIEDNTIAMAGQLVPVGVTYQKHLMARLNLL